MIGVPKALSEAVRACARFGHRPTRHVLSVCISRQTTTLYERGKAGYDLKKIYRCSTSKFGIGERAGSNMTPRGLHRIAKKIGGGWPVGTVFKARQVVGFTWQGMTGGSITHRIMWLEGLEPGFNRGGEVDTFQRYVYIHGTGNETTIGRPDSHGCVHLSSSDLMPLYDKLPVSTLVWITV